MQRFPAIRGVLAALLIAAAPPAALAQALLDGKRFIADSGLVGQPADDKDDVITFADGRFHSSTCDKWGFSRGEYKATRDGDAIRFEAATVSESDGRLLWRGTLKGDVLEGNFTHYRKPTWYRSNPAPIEHWFKAKAVQ